MNEILQDLANLSAIIKANEDNMISFWTGYGKAQGRKFFEDRRLKTFATGIPFPLLNAAFGAVLTLSEIEPTIAEVSGYFGEHKLPGFWWVGPSTRPSDLGEHLGRQGWRYAGTTPGMAVELSVLPEDVTVPADFQIEVVEDMKALEAWTTVVGAGNEIAPELYPAMLDLEAARGITGDSTPRRYLGRLHGEAVAASVLHLDAGVAAPYAVATLHQARGQGLGGAITLQPLLDARAMGYKVGILQSSVMGHRVYQRLGFRDICAFEVYFLPPG